MPLIFGRWDHGRRHRWAWSLVGGTAAGVLLFGALVLWAGPAAWSRALASLDGRFVGLYAAFIALSYVWRAVRFRLLLGARAGVPTLYGVVSVHTLAVNVLPLVGGDLLYPLLLKRCRIAGTVMEAVPSLLVARAQDILMTIALLLVSLVWLGGAVADAELALFSIAAGGVLAIGSAASLAVWNGFGRSWWPGILAPVLSGIQAIDGRAVMASLALALAARVTAIVGTFYLFHGASLDLSAAQVFAICNLYVILALVPLNTLAGLGITEAFLFVLFVSSGIEHTLAAAASIEIHLLQLAVAIVLGGAGIMQLTWTGQTAEPAA